MRSLVFPAKPTQLAVIHMVDMDCSHSRLRSGTQFSKTQPPLSQNRGLANPSLVLTKRHEQQLFHLPTALALVVCHLPRVLLNSAARNWRVRRLCSSVWKTRVEPPGFHTAAVSDNPSCGDTQAGRAEWRATCVPVIGGARRWFVSQPCYPERCTHVFKSKPTAFSQDIKQLTPRT